MGKTAADLQQQQQDPPKDPPKLEEPPGIPVPKEEPTPPPPAANGDVPPATETKPTKTFTAEDIERVRKEEKDKLYKSIEDMKGQLAAVTKEREDREKAAKEAEKTAAAAAKAKEDEEKSAKELLAEKEQQWEQRFQTMQTERERDLAVLDRERQFSALQEYRAKRISEETETIMPEMIDFISGNNEQEIEASIQLLREKTTQVVANFQQAQQQYRQQLPGTKVTQPPVGPMEQQPGYETLSADDIRNMDMETYKKRRDSLLGAAAQNRNKGLFG